MTEEEVLTATASVTEDVTLFAGQAGRVVSTAGRLNGALIASVTARYKAHITHAMSTIALITGYFDTHVETIINVQVKQRA